tara:strand:- start:96 stop:407 length:312 start_codon:yes stop_codon:yes gene_type:complete
MRNLKILFTMFLLFVFVFVTGCQTVKQKTDAAIEKENKKLSEFIGQLESKLQTELGNPDEEFINEEGNIIFIYNTKKYGFPCERRFEIDPNNIVIGFASNGCF